MPDINKSMYNDVEAEAAEGGAGTGAGTNCAVAVGDGAGGAGATGAVVAGAETAGDGAAGAGATGAETVGDGAAGAGAAGAGATGVVAVGDGAAGAAMTGTTVAGDGVETDGALGGSVVDTATGKAAPAKLSNDRVYAIFSKIAKRYERFNAISSMGNYKLWLRKMAKMTPITPDTKVIDIAGGTGDVSFNLVKTKRPAHILISDYVPEMLEVAREHLNDGYGRGVPIDLAVVDAQNIQYEENSFDVITMAYGIRNMPDRTRALSEMHRILRPGGHLVCLEFSTPPNKLWNALYSWYLRNMIPLIGGIVTGDKSGFVYLSKSIKAFPDQKGYAKMLEGSGFCDIHWENCSGGIAAIHVAKKPE